MEKKVYLLTPILLVAGFILNLYLGNIAELDISILIAPISIAIVLVLVIQVVFSGILRNQTKGTLFTSILVVCLFALGKMPLVGIVVIIGSFIFLLKKEGNLKNVAKYVFLTSLIFFLIPIFRVGGEEIQKSKLEAKSPLKLSPATKRNDLPDIYYIVPDSYSASKSLLKYYDFDNSSFENSLKEKGFYIATDSASNYPKTFQSLGSSLNLEYLDYLSKNKASKNLSLVDPLIENNNVVKFLKSLGYKYYHLGSWWGATHTNENATKNVVLENESPIPINQFDYIILQSTMFDPIVDQVLPKITVGDSDKDRMNRANYQFEQTVEIAKTKGSPKFVFVHLIAPHEPYFYDENCKFQSLAERKKIKEEVKYINHLKCVNSKLLTTVNGILENSKIEPIIIIQSDEGAPFLAEELDPNDAWGKASDEFLKEKFFVFNSYYLPGDGEKILYPSITPVNTFRKIFNEYMGTNYPILPDKSYILPDLKHLYDFVDVSDRIR